jgi:AcrR family transcriptional regulator
MLDAAERAFSAGGFHGASMDAIAREAGISKPMLYNYFGSKEGLYVAFLNRAGQDLARRLLEADTEGDPLEKRLAAGVGAFFGYVDEHRDGWRVLREELGRQGEPLGGQMADLRGLIATLVADLLADERPPASPEERDRLAAFGYAFIGAGQSLADWWLDHPDVPLEHLTAVLVAMAAQPA